MFEMNLSFGECVPGLQALSLELGLFRTMSSKTFFLPTHAFAKTDRMLSVKRDASGCLLLIGSPLPMPTNYICFTFSVFPVKSSLMTVLRRRSAISNGE